MTNNLFALAMAFLMLGLALNTIAATQHGTVRTALMIVGIIFFVISAALNGAIISARRRQR